MDFGALYWSLSGGKSGSEGPGFSFVGKSRGGTLRGTGKRCCRGVVLVGGSVAGECGEMVGAGKYGGRMGREMGVCAGVVAKKRGDLE